MKKAIYTTGATLIVALLSWTGYLTAQFYSYPQKSARLINEVSIEFDKANKLGCELGRYMDANKDPLGIQYIENHCSQSSLKEDERRRIEYAEMQATLDGMPGHN